MKRKEILDQLDAATRKYEFPMLDNGYIFHVDQRMHIMRTENMWMIIVEAVGYSPRAWENNGIHNCLYLYGSNLQSAPGRDKDDNGFLTPLDHPQEDVFDEKYNWGVNPSVNSIMIKGKEIPVDLSPQKLEAKGIELTEPPAIDSAALMRSLVPENRDLLLATPSEIAERNPHEIPTVLVLEEWNHPDIAADLLPSKSETFQMLAEVIETGDVSRYKPLDRPNTHWHNWPTGGGL